MTSLFRGTSIVTGASTGIGFEFADELASRGMNLVVVARNTEKLEQVAQLLRSKHGVLVEVLTADLSDREQIDTVAQRASKDDIDLIINNAGFGLNESFFDNSVEAEQKLLDVWLLL